MVYMKSNSLVSMLFSRHIQAYIVKIERPTIKRIGIGQNQIKLIAAVRAKRRCFLKSMSIYIEIQCSNQYLWTKNSKIHSVKWMANIYLLPFDFYSLSILLRNASTFFYVLLCYLFVFYYWNLILCTAWFCALWINSKDENCKMSTNVEVCLEMIALFRF